MCPLAGQRGWRPARARGGRRLAEAGEEEGGQPGRATRMAGEATRVTGQATKKAASLAEQRGREDDWWTNKGE